MIRTRDVFILMMAILLVGIGIIVTIFLHPDSFSKTATLLLLSSPTETQFSVEGGHAEKNRNATIERLRSLIAQGGTTITPSPSVESTVPEASQSTTTAHEQTQSSLLLCGGDDSLALKAQWPASVSVQIENGERIVSVSVTTETSAVSSSTTVPTDVTIVQKKLLVTRAFPVKRGTPECVPGSVVGVTASGGLITNDASFYGEYGAESLIGYARDGFPIYGFYEGAVDVCGGYQHVNGYRYTLSKERSTVLNCFYSTPSSFTL
ncbi:MAG: hypothetical protein RLZZ76_62 [Candidatus Parcubacteria bacterium]|jgi:hypothetical protein